MERNGVIEKERTSRERKLKLHGTTISILPALFSDDKTSRCVCNYVISFLIHIPAQSFNSGSVSHPSDVSLIAALSRFIRPN